MLIEKFVLRRSTGRAICHFAERMGVVYVKMAQILAMQNYGNVFTEEDRVALSQICDDCKTISFRKIRHLLEQEYHCDIYKKFREIDEKPLGAASISQVHRAVLLDGREVAVKIKRQDVTRRVTRDTRQIQRIIKHFGRLAKFRNFLGSSVALDLWASWILEETDFVNERRNIKRYREFGDSVNGACRGTVNIVTPELYEDLCTDNIIVMELIKTSTVNRLALTDENKQRIKVATNDYLSLSFYAMFHDMPVVFHGDPHSGNLYLDEKGNIGFLDMGLIFELTKEETQFARKLFLMAYTGRGKELAELLIMESMRGDINRATFIQEIQAEAGRVQEIPVTQFFVEMMNIFTKYNISPPIVFFKMAKAFLALFGINNFVGNFADTKSLLMSQVAEFYLQETLGEMRGVLVDGLQLLPGLLKSTLEKGLVGGIASQAPSINDLSRRFTNVLDNCHDLVEVIGV